MLIAEARKILRGGNVAALLPQYNDNNVVPLWKSNAEKEKVYIIKNGSNPHSECHIYGLSSRGPFF